MQAVVLGTARQVGIQFLAQQLRRVLRHHVVVDLIQISSPPLRFPLAGQGVRLMRTRSTGALGSHIPIPNLAGEREKGRFTSASDRRAWRHLMAPFPPERFQIDLNMNEMKFRSQWWLWMKWPMGASRKHNFYEYISSRYLICISKFPQFIWM